MSTHSDSNMFAGSLRAVSTLLLCVLLSGCASLQPHSQPVAQWSRAELTFESKLTYANPLQEARLQVAFTSPSGRVVTVDGFWDGNLTWRARFMPDELGAWKWQTECSDKANGGLNRAKGQFECVAAAGKDRFSQHGAIRVATDKRHLEHADGTPFFWLGDTCWNGALLSKPEDWSQYIRERTRQQFTAVQWVATQWRASPEGDLLKRKAFTGTDKIAVNPEFFQQLDAKADALNRAGLLNVPVLLWAIGSGSDPKVNPGFVLPEDQAILLARYMVARWQANHVVWILPGDGDYRGPKAERWKRIGQGVFGGRPHAPTMLHPGGMHWVWNEFKDEAWLDLMGYQSGHGDDAKTLQWMLTGPPATDWKKEPFRPFLNLEPPYENHVAYQSKARIAPETTRRAVYWSLLNAPTAGITYGGHGIWGWDDGTRPPTDHPRSGVPLPWQKALLMPAAEQMAHLAKLFSAIPFEQLRPAPEVLVHQPGEEKPALWLAAARTLDKSTTVIYTPLLQNIELRQRDLPPGFKLTWRNPRDGSTSAVVGVVNGSNLIVAPPSEGDWVLLIQGQPSAKNPQSNPN